MRASVYVVFNFDFDLKQARERERESERGTNSACAHRCQAIFLILKKKPNEIAEWNQLNELHCDEEMKIRKKGEQRKNSRIKLVGMFSVTIFSFILVHIICNTKDFFCASSCPWTHSLLRVRVRVCEWASKHCAPYVRWFFYSISLLDFYWMDIWSMLLKRTAICCVREQAYSLWYRLLPDHLNNNGTVPVKRCVVFPSNK